MGSWPGLWPPWRLWGPPLPRPCVSSRLPPGSGVLLGCGPALAHPSSLQQQQLQPLSHHAPPVPLTPRPAGLVGSSATGLLALSGALAAQAQLAAAAKEDRAGGEAEGPRGEWAAQGGIGQGDKGGEGNWQATPSRAPNSLKCE